MAEKNGTPPGRNVFEKETGIRRAEWHGTHWRSWGDALAEAGFQPNQLQGKHSSGELLQKYAEVVRHFGRVPAEIDIRMYSRGRADFPGHTTFPNHFGNKAGLLAALAEWAKQNLEFSDVLDLLPKQEVSQVTSAPQKEGYVYLLKSGNFYKIGRSDDVVRRVNQISIAMPENVELVHAIRTDDPPGIESYWHRRFSDKRANGEWFGLNATDLKAFKRRSFQ